jgi:hypothetical protein
MEEWQGGWRIQKRVVNRQSKFGWPSWDVCSSSMGILDVSGFTYQWKLTPTCHFVQIHSVTHGHTGSQTFPRIINSLLWIVRLREVLLPGKITISVVCFSFFLLCATLLTISFQVGTKTTDLPKSSIHTSIGYSIMLKGSANYASANTVVLAEHKNKSMKSFHSPHARQVPKGPEDPRSSNKQGSSRLLGMLQA